MTMQLIGMAAAFTLGLTIAYLLNQISNPYPQPTPPAADTLFDRACDWLDQTVPLVAEANTYGAYGQWPRNQHVVELLAGVGEWRQANPDGAPCGHDVYAWAEETDAAKAEAWKAGADIGYGVGTGEIPGGPTADRVRRIVADRNARAGVTTTGGAA